MGVKKKTSGQPFNRTGFSLGGLILENETDQSAGETTGRLISARKHIQLILSSAAFRSGFCDIRLPLSAVDVCVCCLGVCVAVSSQVECEHTYMHDGGWCLQTAHTCYCKGFRSIIERSCKPEETLRGVLMQGLTFCSMWNIWFTKMTWGGREKLYNGSSQRKTPCS